MIDLLIETASKLYDAMIRGVAWGLSFSIALAFVVPAMKYVPRLLKAIGW